MNPACVNVDVNGCFSLCVSLAMDWLPNQYTNTHKSFYSAVHYCRQWIVQLDWQLLFICTFVACCLEVSGLSPMERSGWGGRAAPKAPWLSAILFNFWRWNRVKQVVKPTLMHIQEYTWVVSTNEYYFKRKF